MELNDKIMSCKKIMEQLIQFAAEKPLQSLVFIGMNEEKELVYGKSNMQYEEIYNLISVLKNKIDTEYITDEINYALNSLLDVIEEIDKENYIQSYLPKVEDGIKVDENAYDFLETVLDEYTEKRNKDNPEKE